MTEVCVCVCAQMCAHVHTWVGAYQCMLVRPVPRGSQQCVGSQQDSLDPAPAHRGVWRLPSMSPRVFCQARGHICSCLQDAWEHMGCDMSLGPSSPRPSVERHARQGWLGSGPRPRPWPSPMWGPAMRTRAGIGNWAFWTCICRELPPPGELMCYYFVLKLSDVNKPHVHLFRLDFACT